MTSGTSRGTPLIAVLEDDSFQRTWFERLMERAGFRVRTYGDPRDFLARRSERPLPDVLLLDIVLLDMDAFQVMAELEEDAYWCQVPVVLMTASATKDRVMAAQRLILRPEGFLAKPVEIKSTLTLIRAICDAQDPAMRLRQLQRQHRSSEIHIRRNLKDLDKAMGGNEENARKYARRRVEALRRAQELRLQEATLRPIGGQKDSLAEEIRQAEADAELCRTQARIDESERRQALGTEITLHRRHLQELETEMSALALRIRMLGPDASIKAAPASAVAPTGGEAPASAVAPTGGEAPASAVAPAGTATPPIEAGTPTADPSSSPAESATPPVAVDTPPAEAAPKPATPTTPSPRPAESPADTAVPANPAAEETLDSQRDAA